MNKEHIAYILRLCILLWNIFVVWYASIRLSPLVPESEVLGVYIFIPALLANIIQIALYTKLPKKIPALLSIGVVPMAWVLLFIFISGSRFTDFMIDVGIVALAAGAVNLSIVIFGLILSGFLDTTGSPVIRKRRYMAVYLPVYIIIVCLSFVGVGYAAWEWFQQSTIVGLILVAVSIVHQCIAYYTVVRQTWQPAHV